MADTLDMLLKLSLVLFMAGSLLGMGLALDVKDAVAGLRDPWFIGYAVLFGFIVGPLMAWMLTRIIPLAEPYALGLLLIGLTPCAPFLPAMVTRARGDMNYAAAIMLLSAIGTVLILPFAVPLISPGATVRAWTIAEPLVVLVLLPLAVGMAAFRAAPRLAGLIQPVVKTIASVAAIVALALCMIIYGADFASSIGSFAIGTQALFFTVMTALPYALSGNLALNRRSVLALGLCTRNVGAALAPLFQIAASDERAIVMVVLAVPMQIVFALLAARWFAAGEKATPAPGL